MLSETPAFFGASWGPDDTILLGTARLGVLRVPGAGGAPEVIVPVEGGEVNLVRPLFDLPARLGGGVQYDVAPDGQRFLFVVPEDDGSVAPEINVVQNWHQELLERVPID